MSHPPGTVLMPGHEWSAKYPGHIHVGGGNYRLPFIFRGRNRNRYKVEVTCAHCGELHLRDRANHRKAEHYRAFCSSECRAANIRDRSNGNTVRKKKANGDYGYILEKCYGHPRADRNHMVPQHILIAESKYGRLINKGEIVHHVNCVPNDNRPSNLFVCDDTQDHQIIHASLNECVAELLDMGALVFDEDLKKYRVVKS